MSVLLAATGLSKRFGGLLAVDGLSLELRAGRLLGLTQPAQFMELLKEKGV